MFTAMVPIAARPVGVAIQSGGYLPPSYRNSQRLDPLDGARVARGVRPARHQAMLHAINATLTAANKPPIS